MSKHLKLPSIKKSSLHMLRSVIGKIVMELNKLAFPGFRQQMNQRKENLKKSFPLLIMTDYTICYSNKMSNQILEKLFKKKLVPGHYQFITLPFYRKTISKTKKLIFR